MMGNKDSEQDVWIPRIGYAVSISYAVGFTHSTGIRFGTLTPVI
jgi:hypothetical protein